MKKFLCLLTMFSLCVGAFTGAALAVEENGDVMDYNFFDLPKLVSWIEVPIPDYEVLELPPAQANSKVEFNARVYSFGAKEAGEFHIAPMTADVGELAKACWPDIDGEEMETNITGTVEAFMYEGQSCSYDAQSGVFRYLREADWSSVDMFSNKGGAVKFCFTAKEREENPCTDPKYVEPDDVMRQASDYMAALSSDLMPVLIGADQYLLTRNKESRLLECYNFALSYDGIPLANHDMSLSGASHIIPGQEMVLIYDEEGLLEMKCSLSQITPVEESVRKIQLNLAVATAQTGEGLFYGGGKISMIELQYLPVAEEVEGIRYAPYWCMSGDTQVPLSSLFMDATMGEYSAYDGTSLEV